MLDSLRYNQNMSKRKMKRVIDTHSKIAKTLISDVKTYLYLLQIFSQNIHI